jgi:hypothetical protein
MQDNAYEVLKELVEAHDAPQPADDAPISGTEFVLQLSAYHERLAAAWEAARKKVLDK